MITLEIIRTAKGGEYVLVPNDRVEKVARSQRSRAAELQKKAQAIRDELARNEHTEADELEAVAADCEAQAKGLLEGVESSLKITARIREIAEGKIELVEIPFTPYTDGQKQDAISQATDYSTGSPKLDVGLMNRLLVQASTGVSIADQRAWSVAKAQAVQQEVIDQSEPDPLRLDFLS